MCKCLVFKFVCFLLRSQREKLYSHRNKCFHRNNGGKWHYFNRNHLLCCVWDEKRLKKKHQDFFFVTIFFKPFSFDSSGISSWKLIIISRWKFTCFWDQQVNSNFCVFELSFFLKWGTEYSTGKCLLSTHRALQIMAPPLFSLNGIFKMFSSTYLHWSAQLKIQKKTIMLVF